MTTRAATEYRYEKLTWPEINDAVELGKVSVGIEIAHALACALGMKLSELVREAE